MNKINFPKDYFKDEYIEGFLVESMVKRAWAAQLEILKRVEEICDKYGLQYFGFWGTLLGAVRHNGYVPWDDDFDIIMKRADYDKFIEVAASELPEGYVVISPYTEVEWQEQLARVTNSHAINFTDEFLDDYHGFPFVTGVDIFPYDYIPDDENLYQEKESLLSHVVSARDAYIDKRDKIADGTYKNELEDTLNTEILFLEKIFNIEFNRDTFLDNQLLCLYDQIAASYGNENNKYLTCYVEKAKRSKHGKDFKIPAYWLDEAIEVTFECTTIRIPKYYELCLSVCYGKQFMTPVKAGVAGHDYPFFGRQIDVLKNLGRLDEVMEAVKRADERILANITYEGATGVSSVSDFASVESDICTDAEEQEKKISNKEKKTIMFCLSSMDFYNHEIECLEKLRRVLEVFKDNSERIDTIIVDAPLVYEVLTRNDEQLYQKYCDTVNDFLSNGYGQLIGYYDVVNVARECDAYYGSYNECAKLFVESEKPVMVINIDI